MIARSPCGRTCRGAFNRGVALHELKRFEEALASYDRASRCGRTMPRRFQSWPHPA